MMLRQGSQIVWRYRFDLLQFQIIIHIESDKHKVERIGSLIL